MYRIVSQTSRNGRGELLDLGVEHGVLRRSGTWVSYGDTRLGQGRERSSEFLDEHPETKEEIRNAILQALGHGPAPESPAEEKEAQAGAEAPAAPQRGVAPAKAAAASNGAGAAKGAAGKARR